MAHRNQRRRRNPKRDISAALGAAIAAARRRGGLSQVDVAKQLRKDRSWVAHIERGERRGNVIWVVALGGVIGVYAGPVAGAFLRSAQWKCAARRGEGRPPAGS